MRFAQVGQSFSKTVTLDLESIRSFARSCGDTNPPHHDEAAACASHFGCIIACEPHTASLLPALLAEHFARRCAALGRDFRAQGLLDKKVVWNEIKVARPRGLPVACRLPAASSSALATASCARSTAARPSRSRPSRGSASPTPSRPANDERMSG